MKRRALRTALAIALGGMSVVLPLAAAAPAEAFCATNLKWVGSTLYSKPASGVPTGWNDSLKASLSQWNNISGANWTLIWSPSSAVHFTFRYATPSGGFGGAPALTAIQTLGGSVNGGDVYFNPNWSWNESGNLNQANKVADVRTVTVHELGHELVLTHPNECGAMTTAEVGSAMNPNFTKKWYTNSDDKAGAAYMK